MSGTQNPPKLSDQDFLALYDECAENKAEVGRRLGVSATAIRKRLNRIGREHKQETRAKAVTELGKAVVPASGQVESVEDGIRVMGLLLDSNRTFKAVLSDIQRDIDAREGKKIRPFERDTLLKISQRQEQLAKTYCEIQLKLLSAHSTQTILSAIMQVLADETPEAHERVVRRLRDSGLLGEILGWLNPAPGRPQSRP